MTEKKPSKGARNLTEGPVGKSIRSLMMPMMIGMLALFSYNIADTYFVAQIGTLELAAISFTFPVSFIVGTVTMGLGIGTASVCARLFGAKKLEDVERVAVHAMYSALLPASSLLRSDSQQSTLCSRCSALMTQRCRLFTAT